MQHTRRMCRILISENQWILELVLIRAGAAALSDLDSKYDSHVEADAKNRLVVKRNCIVSVLSISFELVYIQVQV